MKPPVFTGQITALLSDDDYAEFQRCLVADPCCGEVIPDTGGLRKVRWRANGRGKRGGIRVIYYYVDPVFQFRMVLAYQKGIKDDLTTYEKKVLKMLKAQWR